jgi:hypothetical protein
MHRLMRDGRVIPALHYPRNYHRITPKEIHHLLHSLCPPDNYTVGFFYGSPHINPTVLLVYST